MCVCTCVSLVLYRLGLKRSVTVRDVLREGSEIQHFIESPMKNNYCE